MHPMILTTLSSAASQASKIAGFLAARSGAEGQWSVSSPDTRLYQPGQLLATFLARRHHNWWPTVEWSLGNASVTGTLVADASYTSRWTSLAKQPVLIPDKVQSLLSLAFGASVNTVWSFRALFSSEYINPLLMNRRYPPLLKVYPYLARSPIRSPWQDLAPALPPLWSFLCPARPFSELREHLLCTWSLC